MICTKRIGIIFGGRESRARRVLKVGGRRHRRNLNSDKFVPDLRRNRSKRRMEEIRRQRRSRRKRDMGDPRRTPEYRRTERHHRLRPSHTSRTIR